MAKNKIATTVDRIKDPATKESLQYVIAELDRLKSLPPVTENLKQLATIVNKITRNL